jgi:hypothetical protein
MNEHLHELVAAYRNGRIERRDFLKWSAMLGLSAPVLDLSRGQATATIPRGGTLKVTTAGPATIDPPLLVDPPGTAVVQPVGEYLVEVDNDLIPRRYLAIGWMPSEGGKTWTFTLRQGVRFHNDKMRCCWDSLRTHRPRSCSAGAPTCNLRRRGHLFMTDEVPTMVPAFNAAVRAVRANVEGIAASSSGTLDLTRAYFSAS